MGPAGHRSSGRSGLSMPAHGQRSVGPALRRTANTVRGKIKRDARLARSLLELSSSGMAVLDADGSVLDHTERFGALLGTDRQLAGERLADLLRPDDRCRVAEALDAIGEGRISSRRLRCLAASIESPLEVILHGRLTDRRIAGVVVEIRQVADVRALELKLKHAAYRDPLTGLRNRVAFLDRVRIAAAASREGLPRRPCRCDRRPAVGPVSWRFSRTALRPGGP